MEYNTNMNTPTPQTDALRESLTPLIGRVTATYAVEQFIMKCKELEIELSEWQEVAREFGKYLIRINGGGSETCPCPSCKALRRLAELERNINPPNK